VLGERAKIGPVSSSAADRDRRSAPRALLLDALGTLVWLENPGPALREELAARHGIEVTQTQAAEAMAREIGYYRAHIDEGRDVASLASLRRRCAEVVRAALPESEQLAQLPVDELTGTLLAALRFSTFADVRPVVSAARAAGLRVVVVSNWDVSLAEVLGRLELTPLFDAVVTSAHVGARKPAAEIFTRTLAVAGVQAGEAIHVGDSMVEDVVGARGVGIEPILIRRDGAPGPDDVRTIKSLEELDLNRA
jgi:putative hydrolase of the HAD superfamily